MRFCVWNLNKIQSRGIWKLVEITKNNWIDTYDIDCTSTYIVIYLWSGIPMNNNENIQFISFEWLKVFVLHEITSDHTLICI